MMTLSCKVNRKLIPVKAFYFFYLGAIGSLLPYLPLHLTKVGFTKVQLGILFSCIPFIGFCVRPLFGAVADKLKAHKAILITCVAVTAIFLGLLLIVPYWLKNLDKQRNKDPMCIYQTIDGDFTELMIDTCTRLTCQGVCSLNSTTCTNIVNVTFTSHNVSNVCNSSRNFLCELSRTKNCGLIKSEPGPIILCFVLITIGFIFFTPILSLNDAIVYVVLADKRKRWGKQRLWGTIGFIISSSCSALLMGDLGTLTAADFDGPIYLFIGLSVASMISAGFFRVREEVHSPKIFSNLARILKHPTLFLLLLYVAVFGMSFGIIDAYLFLYVQEIKGTRLHLGLMVFLACIGEVAALFFGGKIVSQIGEFPTMFISSVALSMRFFLYGILHEPWHILPVELLHSLSFGLMLNAVTHMAASYSPPGLQATMQGLLSGVLFGLGRGIGPIMMGGIYEAYDANTMFFCCSGLNAGVLVIFVLVYLAFLRHRMHQDGTEREDDPREKEMTVEALLSQQKSAADEKDCSTAVST